MISLRHHYLKIQLMIFASYLSTMLFRSFNSQQAFIILVKSHSSCMFLLVCTLESVICFSPPPLLVFYFFFSQISCFCYKEFMCFLYVSVSLSVGDVLFQMAEVHRQIQVQLEEMVGILNSNSFLASWFNVDIY